ncbi:MULTISPECIES: hypothetical protein [Burkholderia cepacia complex]|uniref:hypothetical protein n=1 Tax=Burkholderia cepacia complex TaxID=87882 RepID=UPI00158EC6FC|nr:MULTISPECIES: hypothetical protein [Burkholderia cepacia complex]MBR8426372.1 hypothetical protein [Burkholderia cenocepacia]MBR8494772.1 hypothetical protein [Burkholderia cenocepacia]MCA8081404.1 hypothetical protein [Burkholderia cepacia]
MFYQPASIVDLDDAAAISLVAEARRRLVNARRNNDTTPDGAYTELISELDFLLELVADDYEVLEWHARVFPIDEVFEKLLKAGYGREFKDLLTDLRDVIARARYITRDDG